MLSDVKTMDATQDSGPEKQRIITAESGRTLGEKKWL